MTGSEFFLIFVLGPLLAVMILGGLVLAGIWLLKGTVSGPAEEARMIQEIHKGLSAMEARIEALETILLESERKKGNETQS